MLGQHCQRRAEIEAVVYGTHRDATFDKLSTTIGLSLATERTVGSLCDRIGAEAARSIDLSVDGAAGLKVAAIPVVAYYSAANLPG